MTIFDALCGVAMQDGLNGKIWTPGAGSSGGSKRSKSGVHKSNKRMRELWENVKKQWTIPNVTKMERLKPDQVRIIDPIAVLCGLLTTCAFDSSLRWMRMFPYDVHVLRLRIIPTKPRDLVVFGENPTLYVDNELKADNGDIASSIGGWDVKYYDANLSYTSSPLPSHRAHTTYSRRLLPLRGNQAIRAK